jgi:hypothetical protein
VRGTVSDDGSDLKKGGSISNLNAEDGNDAASTLVLELTQLVEEEEEEQGEDQDGVVVCWACSEVYSASQSKCSHCGENPL